MSSFLICETELIRILEERLKEYELDFISRNHDHLHEQLIKQVDARYALLRLNSQVNIAEFFLIIIKFLLFYQFTLIILLLLIMLFSYQLTRARCHFGISRICWSWLEVNKAEWTICRRLSFHYSLFFMLQVFEILKRFEVQEYWERYFI